MRRVLLVILLIGVFCPFSLAQEQNSDFDFKIFLTQQSEEMDWWNGVPSQFGPHISEVSSVSKKEIFKIIPIFRNYGLEDGEKANIIYNVSILKPDNSIYAEINDLEGWKGKVNGPYLLPAKNRLVVCFEPEDTFGEYAIRIESFDKIKDQKVAHEDKINLEEFKLPDLKDDVDLFFTYNYNPDPEKAMAYFLNSAYPFINEKGQVVWSGIWFFKCVFDENDFLIPQIVKFFKDEATKKQKENIILLFYFLGKTKELDLKGDLVKYSEGFKKIKAPNPYDKIDNPSQLDMLWGEFFATGRLKPVRQIISSFQLSEFMGTLEKIKKKELDVNEKSVYREAMLEATFSSALWSLESNCNQSSLLYQYCVGLIESDELNDNEKGYLGAILNSVYEKKKKEDRKE
ncbi:MAG: hypothetical protein V1747_07700 [Candidatus Omnitrophota bacterium]